MEQNENKKLSDKDLENVTAADGGGFAVCSQLGGQEVSCMENSQCKWDQTQANAFGKCRRCCLPNPS